MKRAPAAMTIRSTATFVTTIDRIHRGRFADADDEKERDRDGHEDRGKVQHGRDRIAAGDRHERAWRRAECRRNDGHTQLIEQRHQDARTSPTATVAAPSAYSRIRSQPITHATNSPSVAYA